MNSLDLWITEVVSSIDGLTAEFFFNTKQLIVLGQPLGSARCAGFNLSRSQSNHQVGDERVLRLAGTM